MKLLSLSTSNFRLHAKSNVEFEPEGITGIIGSNETGKSTLIEAAVWALFGTDTARGTKAGLRWHRAPARQVAAAQLFFEVGGARYAVTRTETTATLVDAEGLTLAEGLKPVNDYIPTLLGMAFEEFRLSFLCQQQELQRLATMLPTDRQAFIRQVLGVSKIDSAIKACRKEKGALAERRRGLEAGLGEREPVAAAVDEADVAFQGARGERSRQEKAVAARERALDEALGALGRSAAQRTIHEGWARKRDVASGELPGLRRTVAVLEARVTEKAAAAGRIRNAAPMLARLPELRQRRDALVGARGTIGERTTLRARERELVAEIDGPAGLVERSADAERQVGFYDALKHQEAIRERGKADVKLTALQAARLVQRERLLAEEYVHNAACDRAIERLGVIQAAGKDGSCDTCGRPLGDQFDLVVKTLDGERLSARDRANDCRVEAEACTIQSDDEVEAEVAYHAACQACARWEELARDADLGARQAKDMGLRIEKARAQLDGVRKRLGELPDVEFSVAALNAVESDIREVDALDRSLAAAHGLVATDVEGELGQQRALLQLAEARWQEADEAIKQVGFDAPNHEALVENEKDAREALEGARIRLAHLQATERAAEQHLSRTGALLKDYDLRAGGLAIVLEDHLAHERADARLTEFRVAIAATIRPEMQELMSGFVRLLTDGRHEAVSLSEDFTPTLYESGVPVEVVSGGCRDIAALAMRLALSQMIAQRNGRGVDLLVLDEVFSALDETRRGNVLSLLRRLQGTFSQIILISHVEETRDAVDHAIELEFDESAGMTRVLAYAHA